MIAAAERKTDLARERFDLAERLLRAEELPSELARLAELRTQSGV